VCHLYLQNNLFRIFKYYIKLTKVKIKSIFK
jgi:hypothetical protein